MILYHGSFLVVPSPDLKYSRPNVDFGRGFLHHANSGTSYKMVWKIPTPGKTRAHLSVLLR